VQAGHKLSARTGCTLPDLFKESWVLIRGTNLGQLVRTLCAAAGFEPVAAATVDDVGTALGLVAMGWGITIAPELTPANPESAIARIPIAGIQIERHNVLLVRDGEELSPRVAPVIEAVRSVSRQRIAELKDTSSAPSTVGAERGAFLNC